MSFTRKISSELRAYQGDIFKQTALPASGNKMSDAFEAAGILSGSEIVVAALTSITIAEDKTLVIELYGADSASGDYAKEAEIFSVTGAKTFAAGDELVRFVPNSASKYYQKLKVTDDSDLSSAMITAYLVHKG